MMLPYFPQNPYQVLLRNGLAGCGYETVDQPMTWRLLHKVRLNRTCTVHFHWLHPWTARTNAVRYWLERSLWICQIKTLKRRGITVVWTVHNLKDHDNRAERIDRDFSKLMARLSDRLICHSNQAADETANYFNIDRDKIAVIPHGNYIDWYPNEINKADARRRLNIPQHGTVLLAFGEIRPYKNTLGLIQAFRQANIADSFLVIAGRCKDPEHQRKIKAAIENDIRIKTYFNYIADDEVQLFMNASDIAVLPYRDILTSGAALLAMSFNLPLLTPKLRCFEESPGPQGALLYDGNGEGLVSAISRALSHPDQLISMGAFNANEVARFGWHGIATKTIHAYGKSLCDETEAPVCGSL